MDAQTYKVAVHLILNDEITKRILQVSAEAEKLNAKFEQIAQSVKAVSSAASGAAKSLGKMNGAMNGQYSGAIRGAKEYANSIQAISRSADEAVKRLTIRSVGGNSLMPYAVGGALMLQAGSGGSGGAIPPRQEVSASPMPSWDPKGLPHYSGSGGGILRLGHFRGKGRTYDGSFYESDADFPPSPPSGGNGGGGGAGGNGGRKGGGYNHGDAVTNLALGYGGYKLLDAFSEKAIEYERNTARLRQMGLSAEQISAAQHYSDSTQIAYTSKMDRFRIFTDAQGSFRESGLVGDKATEAAKTMMPILARYEVASGMLSDESHAAASNNMKNLNKVVEIMGGLASTKRASEIADAVFKSSQASGRLIDEAQLKQFVAYGSSATNSLNLRAMFGGLEPIIGEMGGSTTAVGLRTAYTRVNGMMSLPPKLLLKEMRRLGMLDKTGLKQTDALHELEATDVTEYAKKIMGLYQKHGITKQTDRERENAILFGTNGAKIYNRIMAQMSTIDESLKAYDRSKGAADTAADPANKRLMAMQNLQKKWEDLEITMGRDGGVLDMMNAGLTRLSSAIERVTNFAAKHPTLAKMATEGVAAIAIFATLSGGIGLAKHAVSGLLGPFKAIDEWAGRVSTSSVALGNSLKALNGIAATFVAWQLGTELGNKIYNNMSDNQKDAVGGTIAQVLAWFGNKEAQESLDANTGLGKFVNGKYVPNFPAVELTDGVNTHVENHATNQSSISNTFNRVTNNGVTYPQIPPKVQQTVQVNSTINLDGRKIAEVVTDHQTKDASRAPTGISGFNMDMSQGWSGMSSYQYGR